MKKLSLSSAQAVCIIATVCCILWGSAFPCIKIGYSWLNIGADDTMSQLLFAGIRFSLAGILTIIFGSIGCRKILVPQKSSILNIIKLGMVQTVAQYVLFYIGLANTTGVKSSIIEASNVFIAIFFSCIIFKYEKLTVNKILGCIIGFAGVVLINLNGSDFDGGFSLWGEGAVLLSCAAYGLSSCMIKRYSNTENTVTLSGYQFLFGGIILTLVGLIGGGHIDTFTTKSMLLLIYMALISSVAYTLWGILLKHNPVARVTIFGFMNPMFGVILSAWLLGENNQAFSVRGIVSLTMACIGIYVVNRTSNHQKI